MVERDAAVRQRQDGDAQDAAGEVGGHRHHGGFQERGAVAVAAALRQIIPPDTKLHPPSLEGDSAFVAQAIDHGQVTHGPHVESFEKRLAERCGAKYAVAVSSGTAALHLALLSQGAGPGDEVVVPAFTFVATANAVSYCGATPVFVDCDDYGNLCPDALDRWLDKHPAKAVVSVDSFGHLCDPALHDVCANYRIPLIDDAAQALGAVKEVRHLSTLSFNGNKIITSGGGGVVLANDKDVADAIRHMANVSKVDIPHKFWHAAVGFNYRMPNMNAALGCAQLNRLDDFLSRKARLRKKYETVLTGMDGVSVLDAPRPSNCWLNALVFDDVNEKNEVADILNLEGIETRMSWTPLHLFSMYKNNPRDDLTNTLRLADHILNVPSGAGL